MSDKEDLILTSGPLGGLGDLSLYTTLPERFTKLGHRVFLDKDNLARNDEIADLLWAKNPYIVGTSDRKPNIGYVKQGHFYEVANRFPLGSIEAMERAHGLPPPYSLAPRIYYEPRPFVQDLSQIVLVDMSAVSSHLNPGDDNNGINGMLQRVGERFIGKQFYWVSFLDSVARQPEGDLGGGNIRINSLFEYVDALASCYAVVCSEAGSQALAAAVRGERDVYDMGARPEIMSLISTKTFNSRGYTFRGVDYRVTLQSSNSNGDYWVPHEVNYEKYQMFCRVSVEQARTQYAAAKAAREAMSAAGS